MRKLTTLLIIISVVTGVFVSCGKNTTPADAVGTWTATVNLAERYNASVTDDDEVREYMKTDEYPAYIVLTVSDDGKMTVTADTEKSSESAEKIYEHMNVTFENYFNDVMKNEGLKQSLEQVVGMPVDEFLQYMRADVTPEKLLSDILTDKTPAGDYAKYSVDGDKLTITELLGKDAKSDLCPIVFEKQK